MAIDAGSAVSTGSPMIAATTANGISTTAPTVSSRATVSRSFSPRLPGRAGRAAGAGFAGPHDAAYLFDRFTDLMDHASEKGDL